ncbi:MAG: hypothetical protein WD941_00245 [Opitutus sp.]
MSIGNAVSIHVTVHGVWNPVAVHVTFGTAPPIGRPRNISTCRIGAKPIIIRPVGNPVAVGITVLVIGNPIAIHVVVEGV